MVLYAPLTWGIISLFSLQPQEDTGLGESALPFIFLSYPLKEYKVTVPCNLTTPTSCCTHPSCSSFSIPAKLPIPSYNLRGACMEPGTVNKDRTRSSASVLNAANQHDQRRQKSICIYTPDHSLASMTPALPKALPSQF